MFSTAMFLETFENLRDNIHAWAREWGFWPDGNGILGPWNFGEKIALIHSELSEALEKHRKHLGKGLPDTPDEHCPEFGGVTIELADTIIRILDLAGKMRLPLGEAILAKITFNRTRPKKHGKAY
jgi:NTP pyrophosphatase (non-canonical NTP hydrolase)